MEHYNVCLAPDLDSSVNIAFRVHVQSADYWGVKADLTEKVKITFDENKISIPFPQRDVYMIQS